MAVLFVGGENTSFRNVVSPGLSVDNTSASYRALYARCSVGCNLFNVAPVPTQPAPLRLRTPNFATPQTEVWIHAMYYNDAQNNYTAYSFSGAPFIAALDSSGVYRVCVNVPSYPQLGNNGSIELSITNAGGTRTPIGQSGTNAITASGTVQQLDLHIQYGTAGSVTLYNNGTNVVSYSGNIVTDSCPGISAVDFVGCAVTWYGDWSEICVTDTVDTRNLSVLSAPPNAAGVNQNWTGSIGNINVINLSDIDFNYQVSSASISEWTISSGLIPTGAWSILSFWTEQRMQVGTSGPQTFYSITRPATGSFDYELGPLTAVGTFDNYPLNWNVNHAGTAEVWTTLDFGSGFNYGVMSNT